MADTHDKARYAPLRVIALCAALVGCGPTGRWSPSDFFTDKDVVALAKAAGSGDVKEIDRLIAAGVNVNTQGKDGMTPLLYALWAKNEAGFERLLEKGANPSLQDKDGESVTHLAALDAKSSKWLELLIKHKADLNVAVSKGIKHGETPLFYAIDARSIGNLKLLLNAGANPNQQDASGGTPAMDAAWCNFWEATEILLDAGADWKLQDKAGNDLAVMCFRRKPADDKKFEKSLQARRNVIAFLRKK